MYIAHTVFVTKKVPYGLCGTTPRFPVPAYRFFFSAHGAP